MENFRKRGKKEKKLVGNKLNLEAELFNALRQIQSDPTGSLTQRTAPTDPNQEKKKKKKRKKPKKEKEEAEKEKGKGRIRDSPTTRINPSPTRIPVIFKSRVAEQRLITGAEGKAKFFGPERGIRRDKAGSRHLCTIRNRKARKRKCVYFRGIIKRVVQRP